MQQCTGSLKDIDQEDYENVGVEKACIHKKIAVVVSQSGAAYSHSHLARFAHTRFALTKIFKKKSVSQSTQNALKRIEIQ